MKHIVKIGILSCMIIFSNPHVSWAFVSSGGNCDDSCKKEEEAKFLAAVFAGMIAVVVIAGAVYWVVGDDDKQSEIVNHLTSNDGSRLRIVPAQDISNGPGLNLEYSVSDHTMIGVHVGYGSEGGKSSTWENETDYISGIFYRMSF
jgi:hypothetical protein